MQFSANNGESQESEKLTEANIANITSNNQENDISSRSDTTDSEMPASFAKKGSIQNSPVPPNVLSKDQCRQTAP
jgi:hypothetical protein